MGTHMTVVIPAYNEGAKFPALWSEMCSYIRSSFSAIMVYDFDEDNTVPVVKDIIAAGEQRLTLAKNQHGTGVVGAILTGFDLATDGAVLVLMAALSDDLAQVDRMLALYADGWHVVAGSRYMEGGRLIGGPFFKQLLSRMGGTSLFLLRGLPTHDATNAFKIYDRAMVRSFTVESKGGFEFSLELTVKAFLAGYSITEVPSTWHDRTSGQSRFRFWKWLPGYLHWYFYAFRSKSR